MKNTSKGGNGAAPKRQLLYRDDDTIAKNDQAIRNTKLELEILLSAYNEIPDANPLTTDQLRSIFRDVKSAVPDNNLKPITNSIYIASYNKNWKDKHEAIGMDFDTGLKMISKTPLPGLEDFIFKAQRTFNNIQGDYLGNYADCDFFNIVDGKIEVDQNMVNAFEESVSVYLETPEEYKLKAALEKFIKASNELIPMIQHQINWGIYGGHTPGVFDVGLFSEIFDFKPGAVGVPEASINIEFFKRYKAHLQNQLS